MEKPCYECDCSKVRKGSPDFKREACRCPCHLPKESYERDHSHSHCWNQDGSPACGIPLEKHTQCCLCDTPFPKQTPAPEKKWEAAKALYISKYMQSFQKHFGKKATECPDCLASAWFVCEKNIRDMLAVVIEAGKRDKDKAIRQLLEEKAVEVEIKNLDIIVIPKGRDTIGYGEGYKDGRNEAAAILRR